MAVGRVFNADAVLAFITIMGDSGARVTASHDAILVQGSHSDPVLFVKCEDGWMVV